jgi:hypothetical protein
MVHFDVMDVIMDANTFDTLVKSGNGVDDILQTLEEQVGSLQKICKYIVNIFSSHYCNLNIWVLNKFHSILRVIETSKAKEKRELVKVLLQIFTFLQFRTHASITSGDVDVQVIQQWIYVNTYHAHVTERHFESMLNDDILACFKLLEMLINVRDVQRTMYVLKHVVNLAIHTKPQHIFTNGNKDVDLLWILFEFIFMLSPEICKDFIGMARDIYFYKLQKTQKTVKMSRLPILFNAVYVCVKGEFRKKKYDIQGSSNRAEDRMDYLYIIPEVDVELINKLNSEKHERQCKKFQRKAITVSCKELERINHLKQNVNIVRKT